MHVASRDVGFKAVRPGGGECKAPDPATHSNIKGQGGGGERDAEERMITKEKVSWKLSRNSVARGGGGGDCARCCL